jgi:hypothetical protein
MRISNQASVNVFVAATTWAGAKVPRAWNVDAQAAHQLAVPLVVTVPSVIATDDTLPPFGEAFAGEPNTTPAPKFDSRAGREGCRVIRRLA